MPAGRGIKKTTLGDTDFYLPEEYKLTKAIGVGAYGVVSCLGFTIIPF